MATKPDAITKQLTTREIEVILGGLTMAAKSYNRRIVAETDSDAGALWQKKMDEVNAVAQKLRLT